jgi:uncharacterized protein YecT (DUF1311 family)
MWFRHRYFRKPVASHSLRFLVLLSLSTLLLAASLGSANAQTTAMPPQSAQPQSQAPGTQTPQAQEPHVPASKYDKMIFQNPIPPDQLTAIKQFAGSKSSDLIHNKQFRKLLNGVIPDCMFHYGWDMPLFDAIDLVIKGSPQLVQLRDGRYLTVSGQSGPYLSGRGFLWIDLQDGIFLGTFYFHPTNGEPTPSLNVFSRQVKERSLALSQLPPAFAQELNDWSRVSKVPTVTTRYFITGSNKKILLEHDEDYCAVLDATTSPPDNGCTRMNADAADIDVNAAYYLNQTHHATNATAWMITDQDQLAWFQLRDGTCRLSLDPLECRTHMARERTHLIIGPPPPPHK